MRNRAAFYRCNAQGQQRSRWTEKPAIAIQGGARQRYSIVLVLCHCVICVYVLAAGARGKLALTLLHPSRLSIGCGLSQRLASRMGIISSVHHPFRGSGLRCGLWQSMRKHVAMKDDLLENDWQLIENTSLVSRVVTISSSVGNSGPLSLKVFELSDAPTDSRDTYGSQLWPAAVFIARLLAASPKEIEGRTVLELGCGNGLCSLAAARLGAAHVLATDYRPLPLALVKRAADAQLLVADNARLGSSHQLHTAVYDFASPLPSVLDVSRRKRAELIHPLNESLPPHDILIAADVGYSKALAWRLGERCRESLKHGGQILIAESRQMPECRLAFSEALNLGSELGATKLRLQPCLMDADARENVSRIWFLNATGACNSPEVEIQQVESNS